MPVTALDHISSPRLRPIEGEDACAFYAGLLGIPTTRGSGSAWHPMTVPNLARRGGARE